MSINTGYDLLAQGRKKRKRRYDLLAQGRKDEGLDRVPHLRKGTQNDSEDRTEGEDLPEESGTSRLPGSWGKGLLLSWLQGVRRHPEKDETWVPKEGRKAGGQLLQLDGFSACYIGEYELPSQGVEKVWIAVFQRRL